MNLDPHTVAKALGGEARGNNVTAPSPGHNARDRGLSVTIDPGAPDGFLVNAFNETDGVAMKDYVRGRLGLPAWEPEKKPIIKPKPTKVCHYDYFDKDNEPYLRVVRMSDKSFRQMHWEIDGWENKKPDGPAIPYRLPEILANPEREIWLVEGEKDADRLASLGLIATTAPGGGSNHIADIAPWLDGQKVIALPDNDATGRTWADKVKSLLPDAQIVHLPDLPFKGDVSDWLDNGRSLDDLLDAVANPVTTVSDASPAPGRVVPTPFEWIDAANIAPRAWLYGDHLIRRFVSVTVSPGGLGKSSLVLVEALAMASGEHLLKDDRVRTPEPLRVWYWNGEDPQEETQRRVIAAALHHKLTPDKVGGRLYTDTGREQTITLGQIMSGQITLDEDLFAELEAEIIARQIDVFILDPFVSSHRMGENDNNAIDAVIKRLGKLAERANCAVEIVHHVRKPGGGSKEQTDVNDARGASALIGGVRSARVLNVMSEDIALAIPEFKVDDRFSYFSVTNGKANMAKRTSDAKWRHLYDLDLGNGPVGVSDRVGVVEHYKLPEKAQALDSLPDNAVIISQRVAHENPYVSRRDHTSPDWFGHVVGEKLGINSVDKVGKGVLIYAIKKWISSGVLVVEIRKDKKGNPREYVACPPSEIPLAAGTSSVPYDDNDSPF